MGRRIHDGRAGRRRRDDPPELHGPRHRDGDRGRAEGAGFEDADRRRCRGRPDQDLDRQDARSGLLPDLGRRRARSAQAVHPDLRDAEVLREPAVRPDARPLQADRGRAPRRDLHQRRALQAPGEGRGAPAGPRYEQRAHRDRHQQPVGPALGAVDVRRRPERGRARFVPDHDHRCGAGGHPAGHHRRRLTEVRSRPRAGWRPWRRSRCGTRRARVERSPGVPRDGRAGIPPRSRARRARIRACPDRWCGG